MKTSVKIEINITRLELHTLETIIDEYTENTGTVDDEDTLKHRKKDIIIINKLLNKIHNEIARKS